MSERFIRCTYCGKHHDPPEAVCPRTGKPLGGVRPPPVPPRHPAPAGPPGGPPTARRALLGTVVGGKYLIRSILGAGGMGTVYEAEHTQIGRLVAVKVLHPRQLKKKEAVKRFHHEARAAGAIGHPNICEVYDLGTLDDGCPYLVMEKLVGETLADRIKAHGGLPVEEILDVLIQVLSGLVAAHEKGILHRDIKPENVFLTQRVGCPPVAKLLDFGVSKMTVPVFGDREEDLDLTKTGMVMGTPYYMAPEQARGDRNLDVRVDIYACGVLMYEAFTARRPFLAGNYNALLLQILSVTPPHPRELRPDLPRPVEQVIERAMARRREDRYSNAADFIRDLTRVRDSLRMAPPRPATVASPRPAPTAAPYVGMRGAAPPYAPSPPPPPPPGIPRSAPAAQPPPPPPPPRQTAPSSARSRAKHAGGFEDLPTEVEQLRDFADDDDQSTAKMSSEELAELAKSARRKLGLPPKSRGGDTLQSYGTTGSTKSEAKKGRRPFGDETVRMDRDESEKSTRHRVPKAPR